MSDTSKREARARSLAAANSLTPWESMSPTERDVFRRQAEREGFTHDHDPTDPDDAVEPGLRGRLDTLRDLQIVQDDGASGVDNADRLEALGIEAQLSDDASREEAEQRLDELALSVDTTVLFEVVFGTGGPDDRLIVECGVFREEQTGYEPHAPRVTYEVRRILYRFSWAGKSAERVLTGDDRAAAERYASRVVPELAE